MADLFRLKSNDIEELLIDISGVQNTIEKNADAFQEFHNFSNAKYGTYRLSTKSKGNVYIASDEYCFTKNISMKIEEGINSIFLSFIKDGKGSHRFDKKTGRYQLCNSHSQNVFFMHEDCRERYGLKQNIKHKETSVILSIPYFKRLTELYPEVFETSFLRYQKGETFYLQDNFMSTTPEMYQSLWQLENSDLMGNSSTMYSDAKVLELLTMLFAPLQAQPTFECCKSQSDYNKIKEASIVLLSDIHNPPTIRNLSLQIGINEKKLKCGFKEVFGTTIYGYLFEHKMTLAKQLLQDKYKNISEIAFECGYNHISHFSTAFKRRFGVSPSDSRKHL